MTRLMIFTTLASMVFLLDQVRHPQSRAVRRSTIDHGGHVGRQMHVRGQVYQCPLVAIGALKPWDKNTMSVLFDDMAAKRRKIELMWRRIPARFAWVRVCSGEHVLRWHTYRAHFALRVERITRSCSPYPLYTSRLAPAIRPVSALSPSCVVFWGDFPSLIFWCCVHYTVAESKDGTSYPRVLSTVFIKNCWS